LISHNAIRINELVISAAQGVSKYGMPSIVLVNLLYYLFASKDEKIGEVSRIILLVIFMFSIAGIGGDILKEIIHRPRPFVTYAGELIAFSNAGTSAFPSGHATKSVALALPFIIIVPARDILRKGLKVLLAIIALAVCYSRVMLGAHYVSDVLAGIGMALICFPLATLAANKIMAKMKGKNLKVISNIWAVVLLALLIYLAV
jgi:undecaprenyl-diphosphatase